MAYNARTKFSGGIIMTEQCFVRVCQHDRTTVFQVAGRATMNHALPLRRCAEQALAAGTATLRVDLGQCTYMDSTFLGILLFLRRTVEERGTDDFALVSPSAECRQILRKTGLRDVFNIAAADDSCVGAFELQAEPPSHAGDFTSTVLQAHEELATLPGPVGECFRPIVRSLTQELEAEQAKRRHDDAPPQRE